jgi:hypothetical protein
MGKKFTRRNLMKVMGSAATMLPMLPSIMLPTAAQADNYKPPKRLMIFLSLNGMYDSTTFFPDPVVHQVAPGIWGTNLTDIQGPMSVALGASLDPFRSKMTVIEGLSAGVQVAPGQTGVPHGTTFSLTCSHCEDANNPGPGQVGSSVDCIAENSSSVYPTAPAMTALRVFGPGDPKYLYQSIWRPQGGRGQAQMPGYFYQSSDGSKVIFDKVFGMAQMPQPPQVPAHRTAVLNNVLGQFSTLSKSPALSTADKQVLQSHTDWLNTLLSKTVNAPPPVNCGSPPLTYPPPDGSIQSPLIEYTNVTDIFAAAFACDLTRVGLMGIESYDDNGQLGWDDDHSASHGTVTQNAAAAFNSTDASTVHMKIYGWHADRIAHFLKVMDSRMEPDGTTVLDNTIAVWTNEHGYPHDTRKYPIVIFGGCQGQFKTGLYLDYRKRGPNGENDYNDYVNWNPGFPINGFWMAVMRAVGVPMSEILRQGEDGTFGQGLPADISDPYYQSFGLSPDIRSLYRQFIPYVYTGPTT